MLIVLIFSTKKLSSRYSRVLCFVATKKFCWAINFLGLWRRLEFVQAVKNEVFVLLCIPVIHQFASKLKDMTISYRNFCQNHVREKGITPQQALQFAS